MVQDGESKRDTPKRRFRGVCDGRNPTVFFRQERVPRKERGCMAVWAGPEEDEIEDGETGSVRACKFADEGLFVRVSDLLETGVDAPGGWICIEGRVDDVDVFGGDRDFGEELGGAEFVV